MKKSPARSSIQTNTLLNYFKTPKRTSNSDNNNDDDDVLRTNLSSPSLKPLSSKKLSLDCSSSDSVKKSTSPLTSFNKSTNGSPLTNSKDYQLFDLVWAKLDGYPSWPAIICNDPDSNQFHQARSQKYHVQFFDDPISHAWMLRRDLKPFTTSSVLISRKSRDLKLQKAIEEAEDALDKKHEDRIKLIGELHSGIVSHSDSFEKTNEEIVIPFKRKNKNILAQEDDNEENFSSVKKRFRRILLSESEEEKDDDEDVYMPDENASEEDDEEFEHSDIDNSDDDFIESDQDDDELIEESPKISKKKKLKKISVIQEDISDTNDDEMDRKLPFKNDIETEILEPVDLFETINIDLDDESYKMLNENDDPLCDVMLNAEDDGKKSYDIFVDKKSSNNEARGKPISKQKINEEATSADKASSTQWPHLSYSFLKPENLKDLNGNRMLDSKTGELNPEYDPSTLFVPEKFLNEQTPALRQWWEMKSHHFDTILFFKMGKFYEFFHMDAVLCTKELKILFMRDEKAHAGFPEKGYKQYADALIQKGYKVARIEQTETPTMMEERCRQMSSSKKKVTKFDKVVAREVCRVSSLGTRFVSDIDSDAFRDVDSYLMAIISRNCSSSNSSVEFGVCFVDVPIGKFFVSQFQDDLYHSKLRTLLSHYSPVEVLIEQSNQQLLKFLTAICPSSRIEKLRRTWTSNQTLRTLYEKDFWSMKNVDSNFSEAILDPGDVIKQTARSEYELAVTALGAVISCLQSALIDDDILTMGNFEIYKPPEFGSSVGQLPRHMILDSMTFKNLELLETTKEGGQVTLFKLINTCSTPSGKRLLRQWLCQPLCGRQDELEKRQGAVRELSQNINLVKLLRSGMRGLPDLERSLTQIHSLSSLKRNHDHPDARAILFDSLIYRRRRINSFLDVLSGLEKIDRIITSLKNFDGDPIKSEYLLQIVSFSNDDSGDDQGGQFPRIAENLAFFRNSFDAEKARNDTNIIPAKGVDEEYDAVLGKLDEMEKKFNAYLKQQESFFQTRIKYVDFGKNRYLLEIPDSCVGKASNAQNESYELKNAKKGFKRYHTPTLIDLVSELESIELEKGKILADIFRRLLAKFDENYKTWKKAISCLAELDALIALAHTRELFESHGSHSCLPEFVWRGDQVIRAENLRNAFMVVAGEVIPNDIELGDETLILTGPNMAGKTTLMRSIGLMAILAQIGAYVPASRCQLSPIDRLFIRIGAYDLIFENESTFMVEISEALAIIKFATPHSLALIDELGSGTSTFDGTAIASAIITELTESIRCRTIFSTHYHTIINELNNKPNIKLGFMSYMVEKDQNSNDPTDENIFFLYKLQFGICNKSYGFHVAKLAGLPIDVIRAAHKYGQQFEIECQVGGLLKWFSTENDNKQMDQNDHHQSIETKDGEEFVEKAKHLFRLLQQFQKIEINNQ